MNLYFLLEDSKSFCKVLPQWMKFILPKYSEVIDWKFFAENGNSFFIESGNGYPHIFDYLKATLQRIYQNDYPVDYVVVIWDTDGKDIEALAKDKAKYEKIFRENIIACPYRMMTMNCCFETWLLGNRAEYPHNISEQFAPYANFYNVSLKDPENMSAPEVYKHSISSYHTEYLCKMLGGKYKKNKPYFVATQDYFSELQSRITDTNDLRSFADFIKFLTDCREEAQHGKN